ncbi:hypothetical protein M0P65_03595 [Candidatus Gracilibacteria bacterium]|nr:hypothetical protein [Candidatus Gracilibacteria bacterium]
MQNTSIKSKIDILNVKSIEEEIYLLMEGEKDYQQNGGIPARDAYIKGLDFINNLK